MSKLSVEQVSVSIRDETILNDVTFSLQSGTVTALVGHNGAGKSTLMKTIIGWQEKNTGSISINEIDQERDFLTYKQCLSYIPEEPLLLSELTVFQHFQLYARSYNMAEEEMAGLVEKYVQEFEIEDKLHEYPESLSKGMRQKVQTICALLPTADLLLIDEPFMGLDIHSVAYLEQLIKEKARNGCMILITSHQLDKVKTLSDQFIMLQRGRISRQGDIHEFHDLKRRFEE